MGNRGLIQTTSLEGKPQAGSRWRSWAIGSSLEMVIGALILVVAVQSGGKAAAGAPAAARVGSPAPDFTVTLLNGQSITLSSLKGKPVLVNFWHSG
jgi:cytochrome oxidase Cu insertion factor (SCO1/SenC/PrrC family)